MLSTKLILTSSLFGNRVGGHGGDHRFAQIQEILKDAGYFIQTGQQEINIGTRRGLANIHGGVRFWLQNGSRFRIEPTHLSYIGGQLERWRSILEKAAPALVLVENHQEYAIILAAKALGIPVIACPHNLECFCNATDLMGASFPHNLQNEIEILKIADAVFTISREEAWLLRLRGIDAGFLPYQPCRALAAELEEVRHARETNHKDGFLILGSAVNRFTLEGMLELLEWLKPLEGKPGMRFRLAGFGTEALARPDCGSHITFLGTLSQNAMRDEMIRCQLLIVHQKRGAGALTRIPEAFAAGVPVVANAIAARSCIDQTVEVYETIHDLHLCLLKPPPSSVLPPVFQTNRSNFLAAVGDIILQVNPKNEVHDAEKAVDS